MSEPYRPMIAVENAVMWNIHRADECAGDTCWIHQPSRHALVEAPVWVLRSNEIYRACVHFNLDTSDPLGLHPDPDWMSFAQGATRYTGWWERFEHPCCEEKCCHG